MLASVTQASRGWLVRLALRIIFVVVGLWLSGWLLHRLASASEGAPTRPGFFAGVLHGALMPMALPRLLVGLEATIYAADNTGRSYKLGYTCGVNACGAVFFGLMYRRRAHPAVAAVAMGDATASTRPPRPA